MSEQGDTDRLAGSCGARKTFLRSVSWSVRSPSNPNSRPQANAKGRPCLPPLQPLSISRPNIDEWPRAGSDDLGEWPHPPTPGARLGLMKPTLNISEREKPPRAFQFKRDKLAFFDKECSRIADHIYLGSDAVAKNRETLKENGITHVLNCVGFVCPEYFKSDLVYKTLWLQDSPSEDITSILYDVFDYFEDVREQGGRVLVHCCQGVSRSTSLVIAYLMWREGQSFEDSFQFVKAARGVTNPNMGFACQLLQCQKRVLDVPASPNSVLRMFRMAPHSPYDPLHLVPKMLNHPAAVGLDSRGAFIIHVFSALYVWIGDLCDIVMSRHAKAAAAQVIRYERVQGPSVTIKEGEEPPEFWEALSHGQMLLVGCEKVGQKDEQNLPSRTKLASSFLPRIGERKVAEYDFDFELFKKALAGGVVPPVSLSATGSETCLPARENGWGRLRRRLASGCMKELVSVTSPTDTLFASIVSSDSLSCLPKRSLDAIMEVEGSTPLTDPLSPKPVSAGSFCSPGSSPNHSSKSPTLSPSTSDYCSSFTFSPSSSIWSDQSFSSSQPSPSGLESVDWLSAKAALLPEYDIVVSKQIPTASMEQLPANNDFVMTDAHNSPIGTSMTECKGAHLAPQMLVPNVVKASQTHRTFVRSWSFSLSELHDEAMEDVEYNPMEQGFHG